MNIINVSILLENAIPLEPKPFPKRHVAISYMVFKDSHDVVSFIQIYLDITGKKYIKIEEYDNLLKSVNVRKSDKLIEPLASEKDVCGICIEDLFNDDDEHLFSQPDGCAHLFCESCMSDYMNRRYTTCPICRAEFKYCYTRRSVAGKLVRPVIKKPNYFMKKQRQTNLSLFLSKHKIILVN